MGYSLPWKPILFRSDISEIAYTDCCNVEGIYCMFLWNFSDSFHDIMLYRKLGIGFVHFLYIDVFFIASFLCSLKLIFYHNVS